MNRAELTVPAAMLAMLCLPVSATAQSSDELPPELLACAEETDVSRRLDCFDREMAKLREAPEPESLPAPVADPAPSAAVAESVPEPAATPEPAPAPVVASAAAGTATTTERETPTPPTATVSAPAATAPVAATTAVTPTTVDSAPPPVAAEPESGDDFGLPSEGRDEISARVADIMKRPYGELVILLDNGQIWQQKHRDNRFRLDVGDHVTISEGLISGYRLSGGGRNNSIQVERLK